MKKYFDLTDQVALITGASSGLGVQFAKALGSQGAKLALMARRVEKLEGVRNELENLGYQVLIQPGDVTKVDDIKRVVGAVKEEFGKIDILVNNAGVARSTPAMETSDEEWLEVMNTNLNSVYFMSREVSKIMKENKYGRIINIGSIHSEVSMKPFPLSSYVTTKGGVYGLTKALASEWANDGITVNAIGPGYFQSEMTDGMLKEGNFQPVVDAYCPMGRVGNEGELDGAIIYFASKESSYTTGQLLKVDGGWTII